MSTIIEMPKLSDTMTVGTVVKWYKKEGEKIANGDILAEIETDKATMELENFDDGVLLKLLANEGDEIEIGRPLAIVGSPGEDIPDLDELTVTKTALVDNDSDQIEEIISSQDEVVAQSTDLEKPNQTEQADSTGRILASSCQKNCPRKKY